LSELETLEARKLARSRIERLVRWELGRVSASKMDGISKPP